MNQQDAPGQDAMIVITLTHPAQQQFLLQVLDAFVRRGELGMEDLPLASDTYKRLVAAQAVPLKASLGKLTGLTPTPTGLVAEMPLDPHLQDDSPF